MADTCNIHMVTHEDQECYPVRVGFITMYSRTIAGSPLLHKHAKHQKNQKGLTMMYVGVNRDTIP